MFAVDDADAVSRFGDEFGWPVVIKAVHGGGGRGMRVVSGSGEVAESLAAAPREAQSSFGRPEVYVERFLARPRHVEVQIVADNHGGLVVVGDRDCSIQRRYQKLIEEAPAPQLPDAVRARLVEGATRLARAVGYTNAGTIEFLVDGEELFFLEMNTRIQVEHPVTELVAGVDLVAEQILVAGGAALSITAEDVEPRGAAIEVRINAEDTTDGRFLPVPGKLHRFQPPSGEHVRVDTGYRTGDEIPAVYDNLIAKIAVWGADREEARRRALDALRRLVVDGVPTTAPVAAAVLAHDDFRTVSHSTSWLADHADDVLATGDVQVLGRWYRIPRFDDAGAGADGEAPPPAPAVGQHGHGRHPAPIGGRGRPRDRADARDRDDSRRRGRRRRLRRHSGDRTGGDENGERSDRRCGWGGDGGTRDGRYQRLAGNAARRGARWLTPYTSIAAKASARSSLTALIGATPSTMPRCSSSSPRWPSWTTTTTSAPC